MSKVIKVALLDTGINITHPYLKPHIKGNYTINPSTNKLMIESNDSNTDFYGHGTACASVMLKECSNIELYSYKILDDSGVCSLEIFENILNKIKFEDYNLINLSLAIEDKVDISDLAQICKEIIDSGKIIVSSLSNGRRRSYPAILKTCIGVQGHVLDSLDSIWFNMRKKIQCIVDSTPFLHCDLNDGYSMFGKSNSYAAAKLTGMIASMMQNKDISQKEIEKVLFEKASKNQWTVFDLNKSRRFPNLAREQIAANPFINEEVEQLIKNYLSLDPDISLKNEFLFAHKVGLQYEQCYPLLKEFEREFHISIEDYTTVSREDFYLTDCLAKLVESNMRKEVLHEKKLSISY